MTPEQPQRWQPRRQQQITPALAEAFSELARAFPCRFNWFGSDWELSCAPRYAGRRATAQQHALRAECQGAAVYIACCENLRAQLEAGRQQTMRQPDAGAAARCLPHGLLLASMRGLLKILRMRLWPAITLSDVQLADPAAPGADGWGLQLVFLDRQRQARFAVQVWAPATLYAQWAAHARSQRQAARGQPQLRYSWTNLPLAGRVGIGALQMSWADLRSLSPGDVLLPIADDERRYFVELAENLGFWLIKNNDFRNKDWRNMDFETQNGELQVRAPLASAHGDDIAADASDMAVSLAEIEVTLTFELGRIAISLGQLQELAPGMIFRVASVPSGAVQVYANGRKIARGVLLDVDGITGVQLTDISGAG